MAESQDRWASWKESPNKGTSEAKRGGRTETAKRGRGYQETRRHDRDRRDNYRRKESGGKGERFKDEYDKGTEYYGKGHRKDDDGYVRSKDEDRYAKGDPPGYKVKHHSGDKESRARDKGRSEDSLKQDSKGILGELKAAGLGSAEKLGSDIQTEKAMSASDLESQWQKEQEEEQQKKKEDEEQRIVEEEKQKKEEEQRRKEEEEQKAKEDELNFLKDYIKEVEERLAFRSDLRTKNLDATENRPDISECGKLDSSLKKNTAFVKKLKNLTESQKDALTKDFQTLNLSKYIGEAAASITEAKLKMSDVNCALHICSLLHQRYGEFAQALQENWTKVLLSKKDDKVANPSKLRVDLRFYAELVSVGVIPIKLGLQTLANQLMLLIANDKEEHNNLSIILSFSRHCGDDYAGLLPQKYKVLSEKHGLPIPTSGLLPEDRHKGCRNLLKDYFTSLTKHLTTAHSELRAMEKQSRKILQMKGELGSERKEKQEATQLAYKKLYDSTVTFADLMSESLPDLPEEEVKPDDPANLDIYCAGGDKEFEYSGDTNLFEDEDTRQFYENFPDLKAIIPGILYKDSAPPPEDKGESETKAEEETESELDVEAVEREVEEGQPEEEEMEEEEAAPDEADPEEDIASSIKLILESFLNSLPNCVNRELIDKAAIDFCMNMNTKANRKKLTKALFGVNRTRYDLLPFYARLVAVLHPVMPDIATDLSSLLKGEFKWHVRKKDQINIESKLKTVRFIGELTKFKMFPVEEVFHCVKMLLFDFSHHNIEMACALFDVCGRFLYRSPPSHHRAKVYLDVMMRKKNALHLDSRYATLIENAFYYSNPPEGSKEEKKQRPPIQQYIRKLLYKDLNKVSTEKVLRHLRKLDWDEPTVASYVVKCFVCVWNVRFNIIHCVANLLAGLAPYHEEHAIAVVDGVLEEIRLGMEANHPKFNQRRVSIIKFLGELYNYRMVESAVIFRSLYSFISFGVTLDDSQPSALDPPEHLLRLRLACVLIETCGQYFDRGSSKKKLDCFLVYFQRYYWFKKNNPIWDANRPFPMDIEYMMQDTYESVRPKLKLAENYEEAMEEARKLDEEFMAKLTELMPKESGEGDGEALPTIQEMEDDEDLSQGLSQIAEGDEEDDDDRDSDESSTQESDINHTGTVDSEDMHTGSQSQGLTVSQNQDDEDEDDDNDDDDHSLDDSAGEDGDEENDVCLVTAGLKKIKCQEDDDFMAAFDKMMLDNIQQRSNEAVKVNPVDIVVPVHAKTQKKGLVSGVTDVVPGTLVPAPQTEEDPQGDNTIHFMLLTKKGNKPQLNNLDVPVSAEFAAKYREREEKEKEEKEKMKRMVLDIHRIQEEEDYQEMLANLNRPMPLASTHREKKVKYQHPKGAPDADAIFGSKKK